MLAAHFALRLANTNPHPPTLDAERCSVSVSLPNVDGRESVGRRASENVKLYSVLTGKPDDGMWLPKRFGLIRGASVEKQPQKSKSLSLLWLIAIKIVNIWQSRIAIFVILECTLGSGHMATVTALRFVQHSFTITDQERKPQKMTDGGRNKREAQRQQSSPDQPIHSRCSRLLLRSCALTVCAQRFGNSQITNHERLFSLDAAIGDRQLSLVHHRITNRPSCESEQSISRL